MTFSVIEMLPLNFSLITHDCKQSLPLRTFLKNTSFVYNEVRFITLKIIHLEVNIWNLLQIEAEWWKIWKCFHGQHFQNGPQEAIYTQIVSVNVWICYKYI